MLALRLKVGVWNFCEYMRVVFCYYHYSRFKQNDIKILKSYRCKNPFKISKEFCEKRGDEEIYVYGETPLTTWELIAKIVEIRPEDVVFDLGCGRGRGCFWLNGVLGCTAIGIEEIPEFIAKARIVAEGQTGLEFRQEDLTDTDLSSGTVFYLYGNFLSDNKIQQLAKRIPRGTKIITVSFPMDDYHPSIKTQYSFKAPFPWGEAEVFVSVRH